MKGAFSYPRSARILNKKQYNQVFKNGKATRSSGFVVYACDNACDSARMGIIVSKKSAARAVDRNRIKRLVKNTFRLKRNDLFSKDFVILARPSTKYLSNHELVACLNTLFDKFRPS